MNKKSIHQQTNRRMLSGENIDQGKCSLQIADSNLWSNQICQVILTQAISDRATSHLDTHRLAAPVIGYIVQSIEHNRIGHGK